MKLFNRIFAFAILLLVANFISTRDVILEFKGAYFLPTNDIFKSLFHRGGALYGPELTVQVCPESCWYAFASVDFLKAHGRSIPECDPTTVKLLPLAFGLKYFVPQWFECVDFYAGLGFQAMNVRTKDCINGVQSVFANWGFGGIAKAGSYWYLPCNFVLDIFIDYSFLKVDRCGNACECFNYPKANVSGAIFGIGLGYKF